MRSDQRTPTLIDRRQDRPHPPVERVVAIAGGGRHRFCGDHSRPLRCSAWRRYHVRRDISSLSQGFLASMVRARSSMRGPPFFGSALHHSALRNGPRSLKRGSGSGRGSVGGAALTWNPRQIQAIPYPSARKVPDEMPTIVAMGANADPSEPKNAAIPIRNAAQIVVPNSQIRCQPFSRPISCCTSMRNAAAPNPVTSPIAYWAFAPMNAMPHPPASYICDKSLIRCCDISLSPSRRFRPAQS